MTVVENFDGEESELSELLTELWDSEDFVCDGESVVPVSVGGGV